MTSGDVGSADEPSALFGPATQLAVDNYPVSGRRVDRRVIDALVHLKAAAAQTNHELIGDPFDTETADAISRAADEVLQTVGMDAFPVDEYQTGSGTSTNMNVNEVIASIASKRLGREVHPNDHVNASQSTNDTFPTAVRIAVASTLESGLVPALLQLERELALKGRQLVTVVKPGRTHLMDASPVMVGHELAGHRTQVHDSIGRLRRSLDALLAVPLGGTATGNGLNTPPGYAARVVELASDRTGLTLRAVRDRFAAQGSQDDLVDASSQIRNAAVAMFKIANDIRWSSSGPNAGLGEYRLRRTQPGSSIMPGKNNPVACEIAMQVSARVIGNDASVAFAGTQGNHQLNTFLPLIAATLLESADLMAAAATTLAAAVATMDVDIETCRTHAEHSPAIAAALNTEIGYDRAASIVDAARRNERTVLEEVVATGAIDRTTAEAFLDVASMAAGNHVPYLTDIPGEDPAIPPEVLPPGERGMIEKS